MTTDKPAQTPSPDLRAIEAAAARRVAAGYALILVSALIAQGVANVFEWATGRGMSLAVTVSFVSLIQFGRLAVYALGVGIVIGALHTLGRARGDAAPGLLLRVAMALYAIAAIDHVVLTLAWSFINAEAREAMRGVHQWGGLAALLASSTAHGATAMSVDTIAAEAGAPPPGSVKLLVVAVAGWQILFTLLHNTMGMSLITRETQWMWRAVSLAEVVALYGMLFYLARAAAAALARPAAK